MTVLERGSIVAPELRDRVRAGIRPLALALGRAGITPDGLTVLGLGISAIAAVAAANRWWLAAAVIGLFGAVFDLFDGALARATGRASRFGAFLDSTLDRVGEAVLYVGIAAGAMLGGFDLGAILAVTAMAAAFMVSYVRARAEGLRFASPVGMAAVGLAPREVRVVVLAAGLAATDLAGGLGANGTLTAGSVWLAATLGLIATLSTLTVIQRIVHVRRQAAMEEQTQ